MSNRTFVAVPGATIVLLCSLVAGCGTNGGGGSAASPSAAIQPVSCVINADYVIDRNDKRRVAGYAKGIFVGRVAMKVREVTDGASSKTIFRIDVLRTMKGEVDRSVEIDQAGTSACPQVDEKLLEVGRYYVLAIGAGTPPLGLVQSYPVSQAAAQAAERDLSKADGAIQEVAEAIANPIPFP
ncbi:hypothetical protein ACLQ3K_10235 [Tsukamurella sp. DT100]|uniref:hypothetical protein n=1 Tax=Tsukamurella sp. DT100 TaxID=3393415 RepID=UPI003CEB71C4